MWEFCAIRADKSPSQTLRMPSESSMAELFDEIDIDAIHKVKCYWNRQWQHNCMKYSWKHISRITSELSAYSAGNSKTIWWLSVSHISLCMVMTPIGVLSLRITRLQIIWQMCCLPCRLQSRANCLFCRKWWRIWSQMAARWAGNGQLVPLAGYIPSDWLPECCEIVAHAFALSVCEAEPLRALIGTFSAANPCICKLMAQDMPSSEKCWMS